MKHWKELLAMAGLLLFIIGGLYWVENRGPKHYPPAISHINVVSIEENGKEHVAITCNVYQFDPQRVDNCKLSGSLDAAMQAVVDDLIAARKR